MVLWEGLIFSLSLPYNFIEGRDRENKIKVIIKR